ncbi:MAG TPA: alkaline phosphatase family protein [Candidatus Hydrogenedentes bacterium]|mgnify:CR=1 FL=1|nr:alkaline phosphatase family protein [Candidatus Hydrogenedentota bacterium]
MYKYILLLVLGSILLAVSTAMAGGPPYNVVLIGWDAAQRNHIKECMDRGELPHLTALGEEGALVAIDILRTTDTKAGWTQILTGYEPEFTGVFSNARSWSIPKGYTLPERLENYFGKDNIITVAVICKREHMEAIGPQKIPLDEAPAAEPPKPAPTKKPTKARPVPGQSAASSESELPVSSSMEPAPPEPTPPAEQTPQRPQKRKPAEGKIIEENGKKYRFIPGKPYFHMKDGIDVFINGLHKDAVVGEKTLELIDKYKDQPFFFFVHFGEIDDAGHMFGENSPEYTHALIAADTLTGAILQKLKDLGLYDKTLVYVTADHGFDEGIKTHADAPYVFLATNDAKVKRRGMREDITPTILTRMGIDVNALHPPLSGHTLTAAYKPPLW